MGIGIVQDGGYNHSGLTRLVFNELHICRIWELNSGNSLGVFILRLIQDDRSTIGDLSCCDDFVDVLRVACTLSANAKTFQ